MKSSTRIATLALIVVVPISALVTLKVCANARQERRVHQIENEACVSIQTLPLSGNEKADAIGRIRGGKESPIMVVNEMVELGRRHLALNVIDAMPVDPDVKARFRNRLMSAPPSEVRSIVDEAMEFLKDHPTTKH